LTCCILQACAPVEPQLQRLGNCPVDGNNQSVPHTIQPTNYAIKGTAPSTMTLAPDGSIWMAGLKNSTLAVLYQLEKGGSAFQLKTSTQSVPGAYLVRVPALASDADGSIWFGVQNYIGSVELRYFQLYRFDPTKTSPTLVVEGPRGVAMHDMLHVGNTLWISSDNGLFGFDKISQKLTQYKCTVQQPPKQQPNTPCEIEDIVLGKNGEVYVASSYPYRKTLGGTYHGGNGIAKFEPAATQPFSVFANTVNQNWYITSLDVDKNGNIWFAKQLGAAKLNPSDGTVSDYDTAGTDSTKGFVPGTGLFTPLNNNGDTSSYPDYVNHVMVDSQNKVWFTFYHSSDAGSALVTTRFDPTNGEWLYFFGDGVYYGYCGFINNATVGIVEGENGDIWVGTGANTRVSSSGGVTRLPGIR
jgi:hypothetical protein